MAKKTDFFQYLFIYFQTDRPNNYLFKDEKIRLQKLPPSKINIGQKKNDPNRPKLNNYFTLIRLSVSAFD